MITEINDPPYENAFTRLMDKLQRVRNKLPLWSRTKPLPQQQEAPMQRVVRAVVLEYMATTLFVFYACASVVAANFWAIQTASANLIAGIVQGFAIATFVYAISHTSGGHINPAVTFAMLISGNIGLIRGLFYICVQLIGGITGAALLSGVIPGQYEGQLGTTTLGPGVSRFQGFIFELIVTFSLLFTIFGTALNKDAAATGLPSLAPIPIGFSITIGVCVAYSFTGGSLNPARTFGPAVISHTWNSHYIYWAGPMGAALIIGLLERYLAIFSAGQRRVIKNRFIRRINEFNYKPTPVAGQNGYPAAVPVGSNYPPVQQMGGAPTHTSPSAVRHRNSMTLAPPEPGTGLF